MDWKSKSIPNLLIKSKSVVLTFSFTASSGRLFHITFPVSPLVNTLGERIDFGWRLGWHQVFVYSKIGSVKK